jgi:hypothetical protein
MRRIVITLFIIFLFLSGLSASDETEDLIRQAEHLLKETEVVLENTEIKADVDESRALPITIFSVTLVLSIFYYIYLRFFKGKEDSVTKLPE